MGDIVEELTRILPKKKVTAPLPPVREADLAKVELDSVEAAMVLAGEDDEAKDRLMRRTGVDEPTAENIVIRDGRLVKAAKKLGHDSLRGFAENTVAFLEMAMKHLEKSGNNDPLPEMLAMAHGNANQVVEILDLPCFAGMTK